LTTIIGETKSLELNLLGAVYIIIFWDSTISTQKKCQARTKSSIIDKNNKAEKEAIQIS
jgi:hypothetical protein